MAAAMIVLAAVTSPAKPTTPADEVRDIATRMEQTGACTLEGKLMLSMPQLAEDVVYGMTLHQLAPVKGDTLAPAPYVIDWRREQTANAIHGFSAYFPGNHYRLQGDRLLEYHYDKDPYPFGKEHGKGGVQQSAQFANYMPAYLAKELRRMADDGRYWLKVTTDTVVDGQKATVIKTVLNINGTTGAEGSYVLDPTDMMPRSLVLENNPGAISEQTVTVVFDQKATPATPVPELPLTEEVLIKRYPGDFATKRLSSYRLDNLPGRSMPAFEAPTLDSRRYTYSKGQKLHGPMLIVVADAQEVFTKDLISQIREGVSQIPVPTDVVWAFVDKRPEGIEDVIGRTEADETVLVGAHALVRDCGVTDLPSLILVSDKGIVKTVASGYNKHLSSDVIKMLSE